VTGTTGAFINVVQTAMNKAELFAGQPVNVSHITCNISGYKLAGSSAFLRVNVKALRSLLDF